MIPGRPSAQDKLSVPTAFPLSPGSTAPTSCVWKSAELFSNRSHELGLESNRAAAEIEPRSYSKGLVSGPHLPHVSVCLSPCNPTSFLRDLPPLPVLSRPSFCKVAVTSHLDSSLNESNTWANSLGL
jgi:hypothetical protein